MNIYFIRKNWLVILLVIEKCNIVVKSTKEMISNAVCEGVGFGLGKGLSKISPVRKTKLGDRLYKQKDPQACVLEAKAKGKVTTKQASQLRKDQVVRNEKSLIRRRTVDNSVYDGRNSVISSTVISSYKKVYNLKD